MQIQHRRPLKHGDVGQKSTVRRGDPDRTGTFVAGRIGRQDEGQRIDLGAVGEKFGLDPLIPLLNVYLVRGTAPQPNDDGIGLRADLIDRLSGDQRAVSGLGHGDVLSDSAAQDSNVGRPIHRRGILVRRDGQGGCSGLAAHRRNVYPVDIAFGGGRLDLPRLARDKGGGRGCLGGLFGGREPDCLDFEGHLTRHLDLVLVAGAQQGHGQCAQKISFCIHRFL